MAMKSAIASVSQMCLTFARMPTRTLGRALCLTLMLSLAPAMSQAADTVLGAGDVIKVSVFGSPDLNVEVKVTNAGTINFPLLGEVEVAGLASAEAEKKIAHLLDSGGFVRNPQVNIMVQVLQSQQVSVLGQVSRPGRYPLGAMQTLTDMIATAGGPTADGAESVTLTRTENGKTTSYTVNLLDMVRAGDGVQNPVLKNNDIVFVEKAPRLYVFGEVQHPGIYRLERNMTVLQALSAGGGLSPRGTVRGLAIRRRMQDGSLRMLPAKLDDLVQMDDVVYVKESLF
jgi:polysaccharide export outer membrane protein